MSDLADDIPFGATSTAAEVIAGTDLRGRRAVVTGGASGIGAETARALAGAGAEVTLAVRDTEAGARFAKTVVTPPDSRPVSVAALDLADQASVAAFVDLWTGPLHILVNNAGVMAPPETRTAQGWELQFATNHLGHFALSTGLHPALKEARGARVVAVSSVGHVNSDIAFDDIHFERRPYDKWLAYGQSKTANILFAVEGAKRWAADRISVNALNPGRITGTNLSRYIGDVSAAPASFDPTSTDVSWKNAEQGAATSVLLAGSPLVAGVTGRYFEDCHVAPPYVPGVRRGVADYALDRDNAARLWHVSLDMLGRDDTAIA
ncbi:SDR family NAD(P)-dependent oxidoreductase [Streptomyces fructofermentans]|uniref:Probable oxidoreductase n=1 Tax=Streptomyces fructofermentans TaxID=152141 RepID=A0A918NN15_9ACTN|nr:SDR family NAD(P)-dependent oxidoreductase [Streptomyces fructofermentans]GGX82464.1 oxidoreductase [Streptomyces fructofermentans]